MKLKNYMLGLLAGALLVLCACQGPNQEANPTMTPTTEPTPSPTPIVYYSKIKVDETKTHQTWESFGVSGCWWSQYVGGWDQPYKDHELATREEIVQYLYSMENGIGLTSYRYNLGAGSVEKKNSGNFWYPERKAECFEISPGKYDFENNGEIIIKPLEENMALGIFEGALEIDFKKIIETLESVGTKYVFVEQDDCYGENPFDCLKRSYSYLKAQGLS